MDVFDHLRHGGRVSSAAAAVGTVLQIKPLLHVDDEGKLAVVEKPRGRKRAISTQLARMEQGWNPETSKLVAIGHGDCPDGAQQLKEAVLARFFTDAEVVVRISAPSLVLTPAPVCWLWFIGEIIADIVI